MHYIVCFFNFKCDHFTLMHIIISVGLYLASHNEFVRFLGSKLHDINKDDPAEFIFVHKILALLIALKIEPNSSENCSYGVL